MSLIVAQGFGGSKLISQGYGEAGLVLGTAAWTEAAEVWSAAGLSGAGASSGAWTEAVDAWLAASVAPAVGVGAWTEAVDAWAAGSRVPVTAPTAWTEGSERWAVQSIGAGVGPAPPVSQTIRPRRTRLGFQHPNPNPPRLGNE